MRGVDPPAFQIKGQEDAMYQARVTVTNKGRKNDLPVTCGEVVSIIRTTNCPKGKWLARSSSNNCESTAPRGQRKHGGTLFTRIKWGH